METKRKDMIFGQRLKDLREEAGLSMLQLSKAIGVSDAAICKWENGLAEPKVTYLLRLAEFFDCTIDYLTGKEDGYIALPPKVIVSDADGNPVTPLYSKNTDIASVTVSLSAEDRKLLKSIQKLSPERRALLKETVNAWNNVTVSENPDKKPT